MFFKLVLFIKKLISQIKNIKKQKKNNNLKLIISCKYNQRVIFLN